MNVFRFRNEKPNVADRKKEAKKAREKFPNSVPIVFEKDPKSKIESFPKSRYLIDKNLTINQFQVLLREKLKLEPTSAFFLLVNGKILIQGETTLQNVYEKYQDKDDNFLYILYSTEQIWG
jgi:hypothetical protein